MPVVTARGAGVRRGRDWLFRDLDVTVEPGEIVAVVGPPGSGRTTVLLALARRYKLSAGRVEITGSAALGYVPEVSDVEPVFTVAEHVKERLALLGRSRKEYATVDLLGLDSSDKGRDLSPYAKQILGLVLAGLSGPSVIAFDGVDAGLNAAEQADLWKQAEALSARGIAVITTARELPADSPATLIRLGEEPAVDEPVVDEPAVEEPAVEEPVVDEPAVEEAEPESKEDADLEEVER